MSYSALMTQYKQPLSFDENAVLIDNWVFYNYGISVPHLYQKCIIKLVISRF